MKCLTAQSAGLNRKKKRNVVLLAERWLMFLGEGKNSKRLQTDLIMKLLKT